MQTGHLDEVFSIEEREFLFELAEAGAEEGKLTLANFERDEVDSATVFDHIEMVARQQRKVKFMELLRDCLRGGEDDNNS